MSARVPLPVRLLQLPDTTASRAARRLGPPSSATTSAAVLSVYKAAGVPYFSSSQVTAASDAQQLFHVQSRQQSLPAAPVPAFPFAQPSPEDTSDSLLARLVDSLPVGSTPYIALPTTSPTLLRGQRSSSASQARVSPATVNARTSRYKGVTLVAQSRADALFLRNASRMGMVAQTYHVLVKLPGGVLANVTAHHHRRQHSLKEKGAVLLNPFVRQCAERSVALYDPSGAHGAGTNGRRGAPGSLDDLELNVTNPVDGSMPPTLSHDGLLEGSLVDWRLGKLRHSGDLAGYVCSSAALPAEVERVIQTRRRMSNLFVSPASAACRPDGQRTSVVNAANAGPKRHLWIPDEQVLCVSADVADRRGREKTRASGKRVRVSFTLLAISGSSTPASDGGLALYEVRATDTAPEEIAALFSADGFIPLNDYTYDTELAGAMARVAGAMRARLHGSALATVPRVVQHRLEVADPEELVALPLMRQPLVAADAFALSDLLSRLDQSMAMFAKDDGPVPGQHRADASPSSPAATSSFSLTMGDGFEEFFHRLQRAVAGSAVPRTRAGAQCFTKSSDRLGQLLFDILCQPASVGDNEDCERVLALLLGPAVDCVSYSYPDPADVPTALAMQHAMAVFEEGKLDETRREELLRSMRFRRTTADGAGEASSAARTLGLARSARLLSAPSGRVSVPRWPVASSPTACGSLGGVSLSFALALACAPAPSAAAAAALSTQSGVPPTPTERFAAWWARAQASASAPPADTGRPERQVSALPASGSAPAHAPASVTASSEGSPTTAAAPVVIAPAFVRQEEASEYVCTHCGSLGHTWHCCPRATAAVMAENSPVEQRASEPAGAAELRQRNGRPDPSSSRLPDASTEEVLSTTDDVHSVIGDALMRREEAAALVGGLDEAGEKLVAVPTAAPTVPLDVRALRTERRKPFLHRRTLRCAYCHGRHHISECPRLQGGSSSAGPDVQEDELELLNAVSGSSSGSRRGLADGAVLDRARIHAEPEKLFCIRCGQYGHLYTACPHVPPGLHTTQHCPICQQSLAKVNHSAVDCPRRASLPSADTYFRNGVPRAYVTTTKRTGPPLSPAEQWRQGARRRRQRGSMLIADSFVDQH